MRSWRFLGVATSLLFAVGAGVGGGGEPDDLGRDRKLIRGAWVVVEYDQDGTPLPGAIVKRMSVTIGADRVVIRPKLSVQRTPKLTDGTVRPELQFRVEEGQADEAKYVLKRTKKSNVIELSRDGGRGEVVKLKGVYALEGDTLALCIPLPGRKAPKAVPAAPKAGLVRMILKRQAPP